jgi:hypothetical protein
MRDPVLVKKRDLSISAGRDWLILWLIRHVKAGMLVEDHRTNAGCYVLES